MPNDEPMGLRRGIDITLYLIGLVEKIPQNLQQGLVIAQHPTPIDSFKVKVEKALGFATLDKLLNLFWLL